MIAFYASSLEDAKIALIEGIVAGLIEKRPILTKASEKDDVKYRRCRCPKMD